jgi:hypothetical protein
VKVIASIEDPVVIKRILDSPMKTPLAAPISELPIAVAAKFGFRGP